MVLARMLAIDRDALTCDLAETYGIFDMGALPVSLLATLAAGLRADSRIMMKITGVRVPTDTILLAEAVDNLSLLVWAQTKDGQKGRNRPKMITPDLTGSSNMESRSNVTSFNCPEEFEAAWARNLGRK